VKGEQVAEFSSCVVRRLDRRTQPAVRVFPAHETIFPCPLDPPIKPAPDFDPGSADDERRKVDPPVAPVGDEGKMSADDEGKMRGTRRW